MNRLFKRALRQGLSLNQRAVSLVNNAFDRAFRSDTLIKSDSTPW